MSRQRPRSVHPLEDVPIGYSRGEAFGHHVHSWILGGQLDKNSPMPGEGHDRNGCRNVQRQAGGGTPERAAPGSSSEVHHEDNAPDIPRGAALGSCSEVLHEDDADSASEPTASVASDSETRRNKQRLRRAKRELEDAQRQVDDGMHEKLKKLRSTARSHEEENQELRARLAEAQTAHEAAVVVVARRISDLREQKLGLESTVCRLQTDIDIKTRHVGRLSGDIGCIKQCSDDDLDALIRESTEALSRMQREREERMRTASNCVVCFDHKRELLLRPCNHMCLCAGCGAAVQQCPLCRQDIVEKIRVHT